MAAKKTNSRRAKPAKLSDELALMRFENRAKRVRDAIGSPAKGADTIVLKRKIGDRVLEPNVEGIGRRSSLQPHWRDVADRKVNSAHFKDAAKVVDPEAMRRKVARAADYIGSYYGHNGLLRPEYDLQEPFVLVDTEAYLKQAINRKLSLMFRTGFEVTSEQARLKEYIDRRFATMEYVTNRSMEELFKAIMYNLSLCSNCFVLKIRDKDGSTGVASDKNNNRVPVAGYSIIPAHTIFPWVEKGEIKKYRRFYDTGLPHDDIAVDDIIHFKWDVKAGHMFGTPRTVAVRDDIFALRRLEENLELLFINHLFPLFHVKVGTEESPCDFYDNGTSEIDYVRYQIENMPKEGVFVTDERTEVAAVGAEGESLHFKELVAHLKGRVYTGLGMSAVDMGEGDTANRATADNISQVLKDSIKSDQGTFGQQVRMFMFKELFQESSSSLSIQGAVQETKLEWHEVDTDGKIKEENHALNLYNSHLIGRDSARKRMRLKGMDKEEQKTTHHELQVKDLETHKSKLKRQEAEEDVANQEALAQTQMKLLAAEVEAEHGKAEAHKKKAASQVMVLKAKTKHAQATGGKTSVKKTTPTKKSAQNKSTPTNQHGTNPGPTKAKSSQALSSKIYDNLMAARTLWNGVDQAEWKRLSSTAVDSALADMALEIDKSPENSYTRQVRMESDRLKSKLAATTDPEILYVVLAEELDEDLNHVDEGTFNSGDSEPESSVPSADEGQGSEPNGDN